MDVTFLPLDSSYFTLILKWLKAPHVEKFWHNDKVTIDSVKEKYGHYAKGYKQAGDINKPISAYIICLSGQKIGYIQFYNAYDFPRNVELLNLPDSLGALDIFIGEEEYIGKGIGSEVIRIFTNNYVLTKYKFAFVDPEYNNEIAVKAFENAGFEIFKRINNIFWMVAHKKIIRLSIKHSIALEVVFRKYFLKKDKLWVFGSRADLNRKGGDIDLYIEANAKTIDEIAKMKSDFIKNLKHQIGEQKIDIVINMLNFPYNLPIYKVAKTEGVRII